MKPVRRILVGIKDPRARSFPAVEKAARLAEAFGAELALFHAIDVPVAAEPYLYAGTGFTKLENDIRKAHHKRVEKLAARLRRRKLKVRADVDWDYPIHEALVRHARKIKANLVVVEAHAGRRLAPWLLHLTDFELLRTSPLPVLVVKSARAWRRPKLLAAVDPANPFGAALPWPPGGKCQRTPGAYVVLFRGELVAYLGKTEQTLFTFLPADEPERGQAAQAIAATLRGAVDGVRRRALLIAEIDGAPASSSELVHALTSAGFSKSTQGLLLSARHAQNTAEHGEV